MDHQAEVDQLSASMAALEAQRGILGDSVVDTALAALRAQMAALQAPPPPPARPAEERRIITILFADVVGSTSISENLDPEQIADVMNGAFAFMNAAVARYGGTVARLMGDAVLAFFGAVTALEDDAERAVRAGLDMQAAAADYAREIQASLGFEFRLRVGINTGPAVLAMMGDSVRAEYTAMGDATNVAARLQAAAPPGTVLISHDTFRYVRGIFEFTPQPPLAVKGKSEPIQTYVVRGIKPRAFAARTRGIGGVETRTVGREGELSTLRGAVASALEENHVVWAQLIGEPGVGKSRLLRDAAEYIQVRPETVHWLKARAFNDDRQQPFALVRRMWFDRFHIPEDVSASDAEPRWLEGFESLCGQGFDEAAQALGLLVGLPFAGSPLIGAMRDDPAQVKGRALVVSADLVCKMRRERAVVVLLEDLQWIDESSWEYLTRVLLETGEAAHGLLVIATARSDWTPPAALLRHPCYLSVELEALDRRAAHELAKELLQNVQELPDELVQMIVERSEGVPYFAEEIVNWFLDRGIIDARAEPWRFDGTRLRASPLPMTLQHLLLTRLSALKEEERGALQRGSVYGRDFWEGGLAALGVPSPGEILPPLQTRGLVTDRPDSSVQGEKEWSFRHALLRDVTFESVLKRDRPALHKGAAAWLEAQARRAGRLDEFAGILGEHAEQAGDTDAAVDWYLRAGDRAYALAASIEARRFYERALSLSRPEDSAQRWRAWLGLNNVAIQLGDIPFAHETTASMLGLAETGADAQKAVAHYRRALYLESTGDYRASVLEFDAGYAAAERAVDLPMRASILSMKVIAQTRLGDLDGAARSADQVRGLAPLVDAATSAKAMMNVAVYCIEAGDLAQAARLEREAAVVFHRLGERSMEANALGNLGYVYVSLGMPGPGRAAMEEALAIDRSFGARRKIAYTGLNLGLAYWRGESIHTARTVLEQIQGELARLGDGFARAVGQSYLALTLEEAGDVPGAMDLYRQARESLTEIGASGYAADASAGLARAALAAGRRDEAEGYIVELWTYLQEHGPNGLEFPIRAFLTCAHGFESLVQTDLERAAIEKGYRELMARAERISDAEWRQSFLDNIPEHRAIRVRWEQITVNS